MAEWQNGRMGHGSVNTQEFLRAFQKTYEDWSNSSRRLELTANFGAPGGHGEQEHKNWLNVHKIYTAKLKRLFADADQLDDVNDFDLAKAAKVSPLELRKTRNSFK
ncbi:hypothetical protein [Mycobacterium sp.]|uniref:hypothetical protein n=2 Tax=Mycobacterium sp. TaxID=1785 RepID=UPI003F991F24